MRRRRNARIIEHFEMVSLADVPCRAVPPVTEALDSDVDRILVQLQKQPGVAAKIHEPDRAKRKSLIPLLNRIAHSRATAVKTCQSEDSVYVWLRSED
jgi:hypothetical protein